jgi:hypothetical protein
MVGNSYFTGIIEESPVNRPEEPDIELTAGRKSSSFAEGRHGARGTRLAHPVPASGQEVSEAAPPFANPTGLGLRIENSEGR